MSKEAIVVGAGLAGSEAAPFSRSLRRTTDGQEASSGKVKSSAA